MQKPLLTAIIFTYNHKNNIARCIESHLNQKTSYDYIIKIYDDCSNDGTTDICKEYAEKYPDKIKLTVQKENTFLKQDLQLQSYQAISEIDTEYFCICDGDDYWCDENKIQIALDFLENHPEYHGFFHDTYLEDEYFKKKKSYIHDACKIDKISNPVTLSAEAPFFLVSSRVFRTSDYVDLRILPIDYLQYYYHLSKGPSYYHDEIMAVYTMGNNTFANMGTKTIANLNSMFSFRLSKLFNFKKDNFCTSMQLKYDRTNGIGDKRYNALIRYKKVFGVKLGWYLWFIFNFAIKYGFKTMSINYIYDRKKVKKKVDNRIRDIRKRLVKNIKDYKLLSYLKSNYKLPKFIVRYIDKSNKRKRDRVLKLSKKIKIMTEEKI